MQRITLLCIGSVKEPWAREGSAFYAARLERAVKFSVTELPASREKDPARQRDEESARLLAAAEKLHGETWVLEETGKPMTTQSFANTVGAARDTGSHLVFLLGGAYGLSLEAKKAGRALRLSDMTLPHELCRVVFLEQLYRATEVLKGSGYHHV